MTVRRTIQGSVQKRDLPSNAALTRLVKIVLSSEKFKKQGEWNIIFVDNKIIKRINKQFLNEKGTTDVIAFPYDPDPLDKSSQPLGDVYISVSVAKDNARKFQQPLKKELVRLVTHGILHILGYDDHKPRDKKNMWSRQEKLVQKIWSKK